MASVPSLCDILIPLEKSKCSASGTARDNAAMMKLRKSPHERIRSPYTIHKFYKFLKRAHCEENLEFFEKAHQFLQLKQNSNISEGKLLAVWNKSLYMKYIAVESPKECNFSHDTREVFEKCYANNKVPGDVDVLCAISHVMGSLMDGYHRFVGSINREEYYTPSYASDAFGQDAKNKSTVSLLSLDLENISRDGSHHSKRAGGTTVIQETFTDTFDDSQGRCYASRPSESSSSTSTGNSRCGNIGDDFQKTHNSGLLNSGKDLLQKLNFVKKRSKSFKQPSDLFRGGYNNHIQNHLKIAKQSSKTTVNSPSSAKTTTSSSSSSLSFPKKAIGLNEKSVENGLRKLNLHDIN
ncbi:hypothetical protein SKDZ_15G2540 [Saccharomyces kudriavzevii ZP591]|nr:hypothetical protein SKDZ_15G2540 [Saccharomyces kudriavzevii ZP591]